MVARLAPPLRLVSRSGRGGKSSLKRAKMAAKIEEIVKATPPVFGVDAKAPQKEERKEEVSRREAEKKKRLLEERLTRWKAIEEAGGIPEWIKAQLEQK